MEEKMEEMEEEEGKEGKEVDMKILKWKNVSI